MERFFNLYWDAATDVVYRETAELCTEFLYQISMGSGAWEQSGGDRPGAGARVPGSATHCAESRDEMSPAYSPYDLGKLPVDPLVRRNLLYSAGNPTRGLPPNVLPKEGILAHRHADPANQPLAWSGFQR